MAKKKKQAEKDFADSVDIAQAYGKTERFINENQSMVTTISLVIILGIAGYFAWTRFYIAPQEQEAQQQMYRAQEYFSMDSFRLALNGDGNAMGFLEIMDQYGLTKEGELASYYAGVSYLHLGDFDEAIEHLNGFSCDDPIVNCMALGAMGDAYMEKGDTGQGISYYKKAVSCDDNEFTKPLYLLKTGMALEKEGQYNDALAMYETLKREFPQSSQAGDIDKYIYRVSSKI